MILERFFQNTQQLKTANAWMEAMRAREVQKNNFHATGDLKSAHAFAKALGEEKKHPVQVVQMHPEPVVEPTVIFSRTQLHSVRAALAVA